MISRDIKKIEAEHLVPDYNGTLAIDGKLLKQTKQLLKFLSEKLAIHVLTADSFGTSEQELKDVKCRLKILQTSIQDKQKETYLLNLPKGHGKNNFIT